MTTNEWFSPQVRAAVATGTEERYRQTNHDVHRLPNDDESEGDHQEGKFDNDENSGRRSHDDVEDVWRELRIGPIVAGILTIGPTILATSRLLNVANGDVHTLLVLLDTLDLIPLVVASILSYGSLPFVILLQGIIGCKATSRLQRGLFIGVSLGVASTLQNLNFSIIAPVSLIVTTLVIVSAQKFLREVLMETIVVISGMVVILFASMVSLSQHPWLPPEVITVDGKASETAYVLEVQEDGLVVLYRDRHAEFISDKRLKSREYCHDDANKGTLLYGKSTPPRGDNADEPRKPKPCPK